MIIGNKTTLMPFDEKWTALVRKWVNQPDVRRGTGSEGPVSDVEHRNWYDHLICDRTQRVFLVGQGQGEDAQPVGLVGLKHIQQRSRSAEYWIYVGEPESRRKGLAEDATRLILDFAFNTLNIHIVYLSVVRTNTAAMGLYRKLGFVEEGIARDRVFSEGRFIDLVNFSMNEDEFRCHEQVSAK
jgi:RimJ/RimL family protein N-acetyltransferase